MLSFTAFGIWTAGDLLGQAPAQKKPRMEEEEEAPKAKAPPKKAGDEEKEDTSKASTPPGKKKKHVEKEEKAPKKRKVIRVEEEEDSKAKSTANPPRAPAASGDLNQLAERATYPSIKKLFRSLAYPHDHAVFTRTPGVTINGKESRLEDDIEPIPLYLGKGPGRHSRARIRFIPLTNDWQRGKPYDPNPDHLDLVRPYEEIAQATVRRFLERNTDPDDAEAPRTPSQYEKLIAAEQVLKFVLNWHESARQTGKRSGEEWAKVEASLRKQLLDEVLLKQMKVIAQAQDWDRVLELAHRLAVTYTDDAERERIFNPVADMIENALRRDPTASEDKKKEVRKRLLELTREFPDSVAFRPIIKTLRDEAQSQLDAAKEALKDKNEEKAQRYLRSAYETWPELPGLDAFSLELRREHPILRVGVRGPLPRYFSPAWACTDSERRAVDLLFESLVKLVPDEEGGFRYRLGLAESAPKVVPLGRQFELPRTGRWSNDRSVNSTDIRISMQLLQKGKGVGRSRVWGKLLKDVKGDKDPFQVTLRLEQGFLDPLALMTFPILPRDQEVNTEEFAKKPITSGPYRLAGDGLPRSDEANRECLFFETNPSYGLRATKHNAPHIEKIRLYTYSNAVQELRAHKLDLVLDLTAKEAQELLDKQRKEGLPVEVPMPMPSPAVPKSPAVPNRRIYFLAINNYKLSDVNLRHALAFAINREELLDKHFRAGLNVPVHRVINGPFPAGSWACNPDLNNRPNQKGLDLFDADAAKNLSVSLVKPIRLKLKYPQDDPSLDKAMKDLCTQVNKLTGVELDPLPCDPYKLRNDVEETQDYDLAYYHYDFPDDSYWLAPLLGPPPRADEKKNENMFRFIFTNTDIFTLLALAESHRNFAVVCQSQREIHKQLLKHMPFIPLWQLDPLLAYRGEVQPVGLDPCKVFSNIEEWRVKPR
jgi:ABC-type oligopeptide transport system substrate-binding subunit